MAIGQKSISVVAENGKQFIPNAKIVIVVSPDVAFFQPSESYLSLRVKVDAPTGAGKATKLQLDSILGGQSLIKDIRILTGSGTLMEEIQDYNILANVIYSYDTDINVRNKRTITEGTTIYNPDCAVNDGVVSHTDYNSANHNPYFSSPSDGKSEQQWVKLQLPLHTGIFRTKKIFPVAMTKGLRIEIMLDEAKRLVHNFETRYKPTMCPRLYGTSHASASVVADAVGKTKTIALSKLKNNITSVEKCPFKVGETISIADDKELANAEEFGVLTAISMDETYVLLKVIADKTFDRDHATDRDIYCV